MQTDVPQRKLWVWIAALSVLFVIAFVVCNVRAADSDCAYRLRCEHEVTGPDGVTQVEIIRGTAAGVGVHTLATAAHIIHLGYDMFVETPSGWLRCSVVRVNAKEDVALIRCDYAEFKFASAIGSVIKIGTQCTICGSILGAKVSESHVAIAAEHDAHSWLCTPGQFAEGCSGAPVMIDGKLAGIATSFRRKDAGEQRPPLQAIFTDADCLDLIADSGGVDTTRGGDMGLALQPPVRRLPANTIKTPETSRTDDPVRPKGDYPVDGNSGPLLDNTHAGEIIPPPRDVSGAGSADASHTQARESALAPRVVVRQLPAPESECRTCKQSLQVAPVFKDSLTTESTPNTCNRTASNTCSTCQLRARTASPCESCQQRVRPERHGSNDVVEYDCDWRAGR